MKLSNPLKTFTSFEKMLWIGSIISLIGIFAFNSHRDVLTLIASIIGVTALVYVARGDVTGQILMIIFSFLYAIISYKFRYYGEMITYLGMSMPMAALATYSWLKNPFKEGENDVKIEKVSKNIIYIVSVLSVLVTVFFYFVLEYFDTANIIFSTLSVTTSFFAASLLYYRSPYYAVAYACNDVVLIVLWIYASIADLSFLPMVLCFIIFFVNDLYGFVSWVKRQKLQEESE